jgi:multidrug resistance efflux pump
LIEEAQVPAQEAGVLMKIHVRDGQQVKAGDELAQIEDAKTRREDDVAQARLRAAVKKAQDTINIEYATASCKVAEAELQVNLEANRRFAGAVSKIEIKKLELKVEETRLSIKKAEMEKAIAGYEAEVSQAEVGLAQENIKRRKICSPLDGVVVQLHRHSGEWVQPGDPVVHVVRVDQLWVEGYVPSAMCRPGDVQGKPVQVTVELARGRKQTIKGEIVFASPVMEASGDFLVRAKINNFSEEISNGKFWGVMPGTSAQMTIQLK